MERGIIQTAKHIHEVGKTIKGIIATTLASSIVFGGVAFGQDVAGADLDEYKKQVSLSMNASDGTITSIKSDSDLCVAEIAGASTGTSTIKWNQGAKTNVAPIDWLIKNGTAGSITVVFNKEQSLANDTAVLICLKQKDLKLTTRENERASDKPTLEVEIPADALEARVLTRSFNQDTFTVSTTGWGSFEAAKSVFSQSQTLNGNNVPTLSKNSSQTFYQGIYNIVSGLARMSAENVIATQCTKAALGQEATANLSQDQTGGTTKKGPLAQAITDGMTKIMVDQFNSMNPTSVQRYGAITAQNVSVEIPGDGTLKTIDMQTKDDTDAIVANVKQQLTDLNLVPDIATPNASDAKCTVTPGVYSNKTEQDKVTTVTGTTK